MLDYLWRNDAIAHDMKQTARAQIVVAAPPTDPALHHAIGHAAHLSANDEATGYFVAADLETREILVFSHHSPHENSRPERDGAQTRDLGQRDLARLVMLCVPAHAVEWMIGEDGRAHGQLTRAEFEQVQAICRERGAPGPRIKGVVPPPGPGWNECVLLG